jgi:ketosteroid isomerase-like protein
VIRSALKLVIAASLLGCAQTSNDTAATAAPTLDPWVSAHNRGDLDALVATYSAEARLLPPDGSVHAGHDAVRAIFASTLASEGVRLERLDGWHSGDLATEAGRWEHFNRSDQSVSSRGTYTVVWRRDATGAWQIVQNGWSVSGAADAKPEGEL